MKTKFKFLMAAAVLAAGFTSCSNDDGSDPVVNEGETAELRIAIPVVRTYAVDGNATTAEADFKSATIFVYNNGALEKEVPALRGDFNDPTASVDEYVMKEPIKVLTGLKSIYVGLNLSENDKEAVRAGLLVPYSVGVSDITSGANGFAMFSINTKSNTSFEVKASGPNEFKVKVERWVAKVTSRVADALDQSGLNFTASNFGFAMGQVNTKMYPLQNLLLSGVIQDPNWRVFGTDYFQNSFTNDFSYTSVDVEGENVLDRKAKYALENTSEAIKQGEVTYISIRANFTPKTYHTYTSGALGIDSYTGVAPASLYVVENTVANVAYFFQNQAQAVNYATSIGAAEPKTYSNGLCYYFIFLDAKDAKNPYATLRNTYYDTLIKKINALGYPKPEVPGPDEPLPTYVDISVDINVLPWVPVESDEVLGKI